jgi:hypothetical protein
MEECNTAVEELKELMVWYDERICDIAEEHREELINFLADLREALIRWPQTQKCDYYAIETCEANRKVLLLNAQVFHIDYKKLTAFERLTRKNNLYTGLVDLCDLIKLIF